MRVDIVSKTNHPFFHCCNIVRLGLKTTSARLYSCQLNRLECVIGKASATDHPCQNSFVFQASTGWELPQGD